MNFLPSDITAYAEAHTSPEPPLLRRLTRETCAKVLYPRMLSGHFQGRLLAMFSAMIRPNRILEIGTFTGYSALCLAEGLAEGGTLTTLDANEELEDFTRRFFAESGLADRIDYRIGDALELLPDLPGPFDLVFLDADKLAYSTYFDRLIDKITPGGFLLADNVLWSGKVVETTERPDKDTQALLEFNAKIQADPRVENLLLPVRDGLMVVRKIGS